MTKQQGTYLKLILIVFHLIGFAGMVFVDLHHFAALSAFNLIISLVLLFLGHTSGRKGFFLLLISVFILGYAVELLGVKTGFPFGIYHYGEALGYKLFEVPVIIGVNWFMLVMGSGFLAQKISSKVWLKVILAALLMVIVDYPIEHMASKLDYWYWENNNIPAANFIGWFFVSLLMQMLFQYFNKRNSNILAIPYLILVFIFFLLLNLSL